MCTSPVNKSRLGTQEVLRAVLWFPERVPRLPGLLRGGFCYRGAIAFFVFLGLWVSPARPRAWIGSVAEKTNCHGLRVEHELLAYLRITAPVTA